MLNSGEFNSEEMIFTQYYQDRYFVYSDMFDGAEETGEETGEESEQKEMAPIPEVRQNEPQFKPKKIVHIEALKGDLEKSGGWSENLSGEIHEKPKTTG